MLASSPVGLYLTPSSGPFLSFSLSAIPGIRRVLDALCLPHPLASFGWPRSLSLSPTVTGAVCFYLGFHSVLDLFPGPPRLPFHLTPACYLFSDPVLFSRVLHEGFPLRARAGVSWHSWGVAPGPHNSPPSSPPPFPLRGCSLGGRAILFLSLPLERLRLD